MSRVNCKEGQFYAVPLRTTGYGLILVARKGKRSGIILGYLFKNKLKTPPQLDEIEKLTIEDSFTAKIFSNLSIADGTWPFVGDHVDWKREDWPLPSFVRKIDFLKTAVKVTYDEDDPARIISEEKIPYPADEYSEDGMHGAGIIEIALTRYLDKCT